MFSSSRGRNIAIHPGRLSDDSEDRGTSRPVALPALAAAVHVAANAAQAARAKLAAARKARPFVHEDDPHE